MTSLRQRLTWFLALGLGALLAVAVAAVYPAAHRWLTAEFDAALLAKSRALTTLPGAGREGINLAFTERVLPEYQRTNAPEYFQVWLGDGVVLARSPSLGTGSLPQRVGPESAPAHWSLALPDGRPGRAVGIGYSLESLATNATDFSFAVVLARDTQPLQRSLNGLVTGLFLGGGALIALMVWFAGVAARAGLRPLDSLAREVQDIHADTLGKRFRLAGSPAELKPVLEQLNHLMERLEAAFAREQRFAASAAHELLTPVSELRALAEAASRWCDDPEATAHFAADVRESAEQMERMIRALLALARAGGGAAEAVREPVDVSAMLEDLRGSLEARLRDRQLALDWQVAPGIIVSAEATTAHAILVNLLDNTVEHTPEGGRVTCCLERSDGGFLLTLANTNPGLTPAEMPRLFEPFWRKDAARSDRAHAGLGLSLVRAFGEQFGWEVCAGLKEGGQVQMRLRGCADGRIKP
jgi:two-component system sensor histidine kinase QseC